MKRFGPSWGAPVCADEDHIPTPRKRRCHLCSIRVLDGERGVLTPFMFGINGHYADAVYHLWCFLWSIGLDAQAEYAKQLDQEQWQAKARKEGST